MTWDDEESFIDPRDIVIDDVAGSNKTLDRSVLGKPGMPSMQGHRLEQRIRVTPRSQLPPLNNHCYEDSELII